jgi:hypothetical protein
VWEITGNAVSLHKIFRRDISLDDWGAVAFAGAGDSVNKSILFIALIGFHKSKPLTCLSARQNVMHIDSVCFFGDGEFFAMTFISSANLKLESVQVRNSLDGR